MKSDYYDDIGPEWVKRQSDRNSYSGLSVKDLADSVSMSFLYSMFYKPACSGVHGADARKFIDIAQREDGTLVFSATSGPKGVAEALVLSSLAMLDVLCVADARMGLGKKEDLTVLASKVGTMTKRLPDEEDG